MAAIWCQRTIEAFWKLSSIEYATDENSRYQISGTIENDNKVSNANANFDYDCGMGFPRQDYSKLSKSYKTDWNGVKYYLETRSLQYKSQSICFSWSSAPQPYKFLSVVFEFYQFLL